MMPPRRTALIAINMAAVVLLAAIVAPGDKPVPPRDRALPQPGNISSPPTGSARPQWDGNLSRPLFRPLVSTVESRLPASAAQDRAPQRPRLRLVGILLDGERRLAVVERDPNGPATRIFQGDEVDGWRVGAIHRRAVSFQRDAAQFEIHLDPPAAAP